VPPIEQLPRELEEVVARFESSARAQADALHAGDLPMRLREPLGVLAMDVVNCCKLQLRPALVRTIEEWRAGQPPSDVGDVLTAMKALYLALRAHQDRLYQAIFLLREGRTPGAGKSMNWALGHPESPVGAYLRSEHPTYLDWFERFRDQRNRIKDGVNFALRRSTEDVGVTFVTVEDGNIVVGLDEENNVTVREILGGLREVIAVMDGVTSLARGS
jgi:hypothetical protein